MLNFNNDLDRLYGHVKKEYERTPFTEIVYPNFITKENWDNFVEDTFIPKIEGFIYFIYNNQQKLLYIGRSKKVMFALRNHLIRKTSKSTCSVLSDLKDLILKSDDKRVFIKVLDIQPVEYSACFKSLLVKEHNPKWVRRVG